jgi:hypothetical protein
MEFPTQFFPRAVQWNKSHPLENICNYNLDARAGFFLFVSPSFYERFQGHVWSGKGSGVFN